MGKDPERLRRKEPRKVLRLEVIAGRALRKGGKGRFWKGSCLHTGWKGRGWLLFQRSPGGI